MSIEKTRYGTWRVRWRDPAGEQRSQTFKRKPDAQRFDAAVTTDLGRGIYQPPTTSTVTVEQWSREWLAAAHNLRPSARATYQADLDRYILPAIGGLQLRKVTDERLDKLLVELTAAHAPATVHRCYRTLRRMFNVAVDRQKLVASPLRRVKAPRVPKHEMRHLTVAELEALAGAIEGGYRALVLVGGYGGLRWSELAGLRRRTVDVARCRVHVVEQLLEGRREEPKSDSSRRWVTLPRSLGPVLEEHLAEHVEPGADALVFTSPTGRPLNSSTFRQRFWLPACLAAGLAVLEDPAVEGSKIVGAPRVHDLRHTAVALAIASGAHPKAIQARMGHSQIAITLDLYGHLMAGVDEDLAGGLDRLRPPADEA